MDVWNNEGLITTIELNITCESARKIIKAKQNDMSRELSFDIKNGGEYLWDSHNPSMFSNDVVTLRVERPDGKLVTISQSIDWFIDQDDIRTVGAQYIKLSQEALAVAGRAYCDVSLTWRINYGSSGEYDEIFISTEPFYIDVEAMPTDASTNDVGYGAYNETQFDTASISVTEVTT